MRPQTHNRILRSLSDRDLERVLAACRSVPLEFGQVLTAMSEPVETVYFPESGVISVVSYYSDGSTVEMANVGRESCTGLAPSLRHQTELCTDLVQIPGRALAMSVMEFNRLRREIPAFENVLLTNVHGVLYQVMVSGACNARHSARERLARWLLTMYDRTGDEQMDFTQDFLAEILSVRRATISEAASQLRDEGAISYARGTIHLTDIGALHGASCECYDLVSSAYRGLFVENAA